MLRATLLILLVVWGAPGAAQNLGSEVPEVALAVSTDGHTLTVRAALEGPTPEWIVVGVADRHPLSVEYQIRLRARRKAWWDRKLWRAELVTRTSFDSVTGRYRCEAVLDGAIIASTDTETSSAAIDWLLHPPEIRIALPEDLDGTPLALRMRAIFSTSTVWLVFPRTVGTHWSELPLVAEATEGGTEDDG